MNCSKIRTPFVLTLLAMLAAVAAFSSLVNADSDDPIVSNAVLDQRIRDYILTHPEVVVEAIQTWQAQQKQTQVQQAGAVLVSRHDEIFNDPAAPVSGNPKGDVTVVEFMDYNCGYCRKSFPVITQLLKDDGDIRLVLKEFPVLGSGSEFAARAALASHRQGRYTEFHDALMQYEERLDQPQVLAIAERIGLDIDRLNQDMANPDIQQSIDRNRQLAQALAITGTPGFVIGNEIVRGAVDLATFQKLVKDSRKAQ